MENILSHGRQIRQWLEAGNTLTAIDAWKRFGCYRLGARINDLRNAGMKIKTDFEYGISKVSGKRVRYARYSIINN